MKRTFVVLLTIALAVALCCTTVFAAGSKSDAVEIAGAVDSNGNKATVTESETTTAVITEEIAKQVGSITEDAKNLSVVYQKDLSSDVLPVTITFTVDGTAGQTLYVFHHNGGAWELVASGKGPSVSATFTSLSPVAVVSTAGSSSGGNGQTTSPETGAAMGIFAAFGIAAAAGISAVAARKKD